MSSEVPSTPGLRSVAVVIDHGVAPFEFAVACEVFGVRRDDPALPVVEFAVCSPAAGPVRTSVGVELTAAHGLEPLDGADLVVVPALGTGYLPPPELTERLQAAAARGATVAALCSGAFAVARAGLLDGRRATTHWVHTAAFAAAFPQVELVPDVLYVEDGPVATSAGTAAAIDLCLQLVRRHHGPAAANALARRMVVPPRRVGGQAQFVPAPPPPAAGHAATGLAPLLAWAAEHLDADLSVPVLARRAGMSERTFARRFRDEIGTTPLQWVLDRRVALAEQLLEHGDLSVDAVARRCGFGSAATLRRHFRRLRATAPHDYRRAFGTPGAGALPAGDGPDASEASDRPGPDPVVETARPRPRLA